MQRIYNLDKWTRVSEGEAISFENDRPRNVRLEVNAPVKTQLYVIDSDGELHFLALVEGRDTIEFGVSGAFQLSVGDGQEIMVFTADGDDISSVSVGAVSFTQIVERRRRNPELEYIAQAMNANMERRLAQQAREFERRLEAGENARAALGAATGVPHPAQQAPGQDGGPDASASPPAATAGGSRNDETPADGGSVDARGSRAEPRQQDVPEPAEV